MNILEQVQSLFSTVFCLHSEVNCDRQEQISRQFEQKKHIDDVREIAVESGMVEEENGGYKDNFLRGSLMSEQRRRHSKTINKIAASYWAHGMGCSCCHDSHRSEDFEQVAPTTFNKGIASELSKTGYINLSPNDPATELQCLTSFITESGRHRVITQEFADQVTQASLETSERLEPVDVLQKTQELPRRESVPTLQNLPAVQQGNVVEIQTGTRLSKLIQK